MTKNFVWVLIALLLCGRVPKVAASSEGVSVTKETQARVGLNYTLSAVRVSDTAVLVRMEIPKKGKLQTLRRVQMVIETFIPGNSGSPMVSADLQTTPGKDGSLVVSFQLSPELADKCFIELITTSPTALLPNEMFYAVELKGYVTVRK